MSMFISTIYGVNCGFEFLPPEMVEDEGALWGILFDLAFFRVMFLRMQPD